MGNDRHLLAPIQSALLGYLSASQRSGFSSTAQRAADRIHLFITSKRSRGINHKDHEDYQCLSFVILVLVVTILVSKLRGYTLDATGPS